jgi:hypothetical protein
MPTQHPKWQKARIMNSDYYPHAIGQTVWVYDRPEVIDCFHVATKEDFTGSVLLCSFLDEQGDRMVIPPECVELLPEFADDIPLVPFAVWSDPHWQGMEDGKEAL